VRMQGAAYGPACDQTPLLLGVPVGPRTFAPATDCNVPFSLHRYLFNSTSQQAINFTMTSSSSVSIALKAPESAGLRNDFPSSVGGTSLTYLVPDRPIDVVTFQFSGTQTYTLTANSTSPNVVGCAPRVAFSGVNTTLTLAATDCPGISAGTFSNRFLLLISDGQTITISMTPPPGTFAPRLRVIAGQFPSGTATAAATADGTLSGGATLVFTNTTGSTAAYTIEATSVLAGQTGTYQFRLDASPSSFNFAPPAFAAGSAGVRP
jgi:hypothetical protein